MEQDTEPSAEHAARWEELTAEFLAKPGVTLAPAFGRISLMVGGKLFASAGPTGLLIKIGAARVAELIASAQGEQFAAGGYRVMREWAIANSGSDWRALAEESRAFVEAVSAASAKKTAKG